MQAYAAYGFGLCRSRELGWDELGRGRDEVEYWKLVKQRIQKVAREVKRSYTKLLLTGDSADEERILMVLKDALGGVAASARLEVKKGGVDAPLFAVARGAAQFQRRRQQGWLECVQAEKCGEEQNTVVKLLLRLWFKIG